jgi:hypothetical protein
MTAIGLTLEAHREAVHQADFWHEQCVGWTKAHSCGVWRERHSADAEKLEMRRRSRNLVKVSAGYLRHALSIAPSEGRA